MSNQLETRADLRNYRYFSRDKIHLWLECVWRQLCS